MSLRERAHLHRLSVAAHGYVFNRTLVLFVGKFILSTLLFSNSPSSVTDGFNVNIKLKQGSMQQQQSQLRVSCFIDE